MMRELAYTVLDVFAERPLEGNPLAVFHDGRGLSDAEMQAIARETNLSETTFVLPDEDPECDREEGVRVRIFTTQEELPFAGHPTLGTASWLHLHHPMLRGAEAVTLRLNVGPVSVRFASSGVKGGAREAHAAAEAGVYGTMQQPQPQFGQEFNPSEVAAVIGLPEEDLLPGFAPHGVSTGNAFCIVALRSVEALGRLNIPQREASVWLRARRIRWFYCIAPEPERGGDHWRARMQWYGGEDPATGSAAGPCIAWLVRVGLAASATPVTIWQGVEMLRPSRITVQATSKPGSANEISTTFVGGRTIQVAVGSFFLPELSGYAQG